jgi:hypothetical protein
MMEAVRTSETTVKFNVNTRCYVPEDSKLHTRRRENLKSHTSILTFLDILTNVEAEYYEMSGRKHSPSLITSQTTVNYNKYNINKS